MKNNNGNEIITMTFDDALSEIGVDNILKAVMYSGRSVTNGYPVSENNFFNTFIKALECCSKYEIYRQYSIDNGKYFIDCLLIRTSTMPCEDDKSEKNIYYTIIEYDEKYHESHAQKIKDKERETYIKKFLSGNKEYDNIKISIVRIKEGQEHLAYLYLLPYLSGIETSYSFDKLCENLDYREL